MTDMPEDREGWSAPLHGARIKLATDKPKYRRGEPIALVLSFRNVGAAPLVLSMSPHRARDPECPLYGLSTLTLTRVGTQTAWTLAPVPSNRFMLESLGRLDPQSTRETGGALTTWAWRLAGDRGDDASPTLDLPAGTYRIAGRYEPQDLARLGAGEHAGLDALEELRRFFAGRDRSPNAFTRARFMGISYAHAELLRDADYRLWSGVLEAPASEFVIEG